MPGTMPHRVPAPRWRHAGCGSLRLGNCARLGGRPHGDGAATVVDTALQVASESCCSRAVIAADASGSPPLVDRTGGRSALALRMIGVGVVVASDGVLTRRAASSRRAEIKPIGRVGSYGGAGVPVPTRVSSDSVSGSTRGLRSSCRPISPSPIRVCSHVNDVGAHQHSSPSTILEDAVNDQPGARSDSNRPPRPV
jgi:hypothetical protein